MTERKRTPRYFVNSASPYIKHIGKSHFSIKSQSLNKHNSFENWRRGMVKPSLESYEVDLYGKVHLVDPYMFNFAEVSSF